MNYKIPCLLGWVYQTNFARSFIITIIITVDPLTAAIWVRKINVEKLDLHKLQYNSLHDITHKDYNIYTMWNEYRIWFTNNDLSNIINT